MIALIEPAGTVKETPPTASNPSKLLVTRRTSSTGWPPLEPPPQRADRAGEPPREDEEQDHQDGSQDERPVLGIGHDLLIEPDQGQRAHRGAPKGAHAAEQGHDQDLGRL